jgi:hypothetical protein
MNKIIKIITLCFLLGIIALISFRLGRGAHEENSDKIEKIPVHKKELSYTVDEAKDVIRKDISGRVAEVKYKEDYSDVDTTNWKTCIIKGLGIKFQYPDYWGTLTARGKEDVCDPEIQDQIDKSLKERTVKLQKAVQLGKELNGCIGLSIFHHNKGEIIDGLAGDLFAVIAGPPLGARCSIARDGYWGDAAYYITGEKYIRSICTEKSLCSIYYTKNNVLVSKKLFYRGFDPTPPAAFNYYIASRHPVFKGIIFSSDRLPYDTRTNDDVIRNIVESLEFL